MLVIRKLAVVADWQLDCGKEIKSPLTISKERPSDVNTLCPGISAYADLSSEKKTKASYSHTPYRRYSTQRLTEIHTANSKSNFLFFHSTLLK